MIIANGTIELKVKSGGGINPQTGYAVQGATSWSAQIPCQYYHTAFSYQTKANGEHFTFKNYAILIEQQRFYDFTQRFMVGGNLQFYVDGTDGQESFIIEEQRPLPVEQLRLRDGRGNTIGEFSIISIEALDAVCQLRIQV